MTQSAQQHSASKDAQCILALTDSLMLLFTFVQGDNLHGLYASPFTEKHTDFTPLKGTILGAICRCILTKTNLI